MSATASATTAKHSILVIGADTTKLDLEMVRDSRLLFWGESFVKQATAIPEGTKRVILNRTIGRHHVFSIERLPKPADAILNPVANNCEVKKLLSDILRTAPPADTDTNAGKPALVIGFAKNGSAALDKAILENPNLLFWEPKQAAEQMQLPQVQNVFAMGSVEPPVITHLRRLNEIPRLNFRMVQTNFQLAKLLVDMKLLENIPAAVPPPPDDPVPGEKWTTIHDFAAKHYKTVLSEARGAVSEAARRLIALAKKVHNEEIAFRTAENYIRQLRDSDKPLENRTPKPEKTATLGNGLDARVDSVRGSIAQLTEDLDTLCEAFALELAAKEAVIEKFEARITELEATEAKYKTLMHGLDEIKSRVK